MQLTSSAFQAGGSIPVRYTCEGEDISPAFSWKEAPPQAKSFVLIMHDPDAPRAGGFTHWVIYNIPAGTGHIEEKTSKQEQVPVGLQGTNDSGEVGYMGPCPPSGTHRYYVRLYALDTELNLDPGAPHKAVVSAMQGHILDQAELMGKYTKKSERAA
jgi:Raf kinase inhibitor-like YbhB/YbcL family protein